MSGFSAVGFFLVSLVFSLAAFVLWLRIALRYFRISALNPFSRLIYSLTDPVLQPIAKLLKKPYQPGNRYDWLALGLLVVVGFFKIILLSLLAFGAIIPFVFVIVYVLADLIIQPCNLMFYAILIRVIMSYANPSWEHPMNDLLRVLTQPLLILGRRIIPDISGFDFSPLVAMVLLKIITLFISASLPWRLI